MDRRDFLRMSLGATASTLVAGLPFTSAEAYSYRHAKERALSFYNLHTGENLKTVYWANGRYVSQGLTDINMILRDFRTGDATRMDRDLMDLLFVLRHKMGSNEPFHIISGYRSPKTNHMLSERSGGVAKKSYHVKGQAIDIFLPNRRLTDLRKAALSLRAGGVGMYSASGFLHVDTGKVRQWGV